MRILQNNLVEEVNYWLKETCHTSHLNHTNLKWYRCNLAPKTCIPLLPVCNSKHIYTVTHSWIDTLPLGNVNTQIWHITIIWGGDMWFRLWATEMRTRPLYMGHTLSTTEVLAGKFRSKPKKSISLNHAHPKTSNKKLMYIFLVIGKEI